MYAFESYPDYNVHFPAYFTLWNPFTLLHLPGHQLQADSMGIHAAVIFLARKDQMIIIVLWYLFWVYISICCFQGSGPLKISIFPA